MRPAIFLDRDGTLIVDHGYLHSPEQVEFLPGVVEALRELKSRGYLLVVITNQSGIGRGLVTQMQAAAVAARFVEDLYLEGITLDGVYQCPHAPVDNCECRKPKPTLLLEAAAELDIDLTRSYMIGDKVTDCEAGAAVGCKGILLAPAADEHWSTSVDLEASVALV